MPETVDLILAQRQSGGRAYQAPGLIAASVLHAAALAAILVAPRLVASRTPPPEYVAVQIVPAQALGVQKPAPPPAPPVKKPEPPPEPPKPQAPETLPPPEPPKKQPPKPPAKPQPAPVAAPSPEPPPGAEPQRLGSASGAPAGAAAFGAAVAGLDNPDFTYGYYVDQMLALIRDQWVRPPLGGGVEATVHFVVQSDGRIADVRVVRSSGYSSFDLAGLRAVQAASPLPPLPRSYLQGSLGVSLIIR